MARKPRHLLQGLGLGARGRRGGARRDLLLNHSPVAFVVEDGRLVGMKFERVEWHELDENGRLRDRRPLGERSSCHATTSSWPSARTTPSPSSSATSASSSTSGTCRSSTRRRSSRPVREVFFGGDAAFGPKNIIWAVEHGHQAAISIHKLLPGRARRRAAAAGHASEQPQDGHPRVELQPTATTRSAAARCRGWISRVGSRSSRSRSSSDSPPSRPVSARCERCLNCDVQTVFADSLCIECDACIDICPVELPDHHEQR